MLRHRRSRPRHASHLRSGPVRFLERLSRIFSIAVFADFFVLERRPDLRCGRAGSQDNLADPREQKQNNALRSCQGQAFRQWSGRSGMPCQSVPKQNGQSAFCLATSCRLTSWLDGQRVYPKRDFAGSTAQQLLKNPGSIAAVAFEPARYG